MSERTILSSFYSEAEANTAADQIKALGIEVAKVEELHAYPGGMPDREAWPRSGRIPSLASLTLNTQVSSRDTGILLSVDPAASGMSDGDDNITGRNFLLTVVAPEAKVENVVQIVKECNGYT